MEGVGVFVVGLFGLVGNILAMAALHRIKRNRNFNRLLIGLSVTDLVRVRRKLC